MKKIVIAVIIILSLLLIPQIQHVFAMEKMMRATPSPDVSVSPVMMMEHKEIDYELPYPGILPDSLFYSLKTLRDRMVSFFIADSLKRAEFDLLQADKRLNAGVYLAKKKAKDALISSVISKGVNYFEEAVAKVKEAKAQGEDINSFVGKLVLASQKHQEVLKKMEKNASDSLRAALVVDEKRMADLENKATALQGKK